MLHQRIANPALSDQIGDQRIQATVIAGQRKLRDCRDMIIEGELAVGLGRRLLRLATATENKRAGTMC